MATMVISLSAINQHNTATMKYVNVSNNVHSDKATTLSQSLFLSNDGRLSNLACTIPNEYGIINDTPTHSDASVDEVSFPNKYLIVTHGRDNNKPVIRDMHSCFAAKIKSIIRSSTTSGGSDIRNLRLSVILLNVRLVLLQDVHTVDVLVYDSTILPNNQMITYIYKYHFIQDK